jgi:hypothetical protein
MKPRLISTFKRIQSAVSSHTKIYALLYVDLISAGNKVPNENDYHITNLIKEAVAEVNIEYIQAVKNSISWS